MLAATQRRDDEGEFIFNKFYDYVAHFISITNQSMNNLHSRI